MISFYEKAISALLTSNFLSTRLMKTTISSETIASTEFEIERDRSIERMVNTMDAMGYTESARRQRPVKMNGKPIPWFTYPAIQYLDQLDLREKQVFEWGCGYSSLYFAGKCRNIRSVDVSKDWYEEIHSLRPENLEVYLRTQSKYPHSINEFGQQYEIIIIDSERRLDCATQAVRYLLPNGMIILDNSDNCPRTCAFLRDQHLTQIDFIGFGPICYVQWATSIFISPGYDFSPLGVQPIVSKGGLERNLDI